MQDPRNAALGRLLTAAAMQPPPAGSGRQSWPDYDEDAPPVYLPIEKDAVKLQVKSFRIIICQVQGTVATNWNPLWQ